MSGVSMKCIVNAMQGVVLYLKQTCRLAVNDIRNTYDDTYHSEASQGGDYTSMKTSELRKIFTQLKNDVIIEKLVNWDFWKPKSWTVLEQLANITLP